MKLFTDIFLAFLGVVFMVVAFQTDGFVTRHWKPATRYIL
jgi:hypothetical protein